LANSILLFEGDAEAQLLAEAGSVLPAVVPDADLQLVRAWATRPELLEAAVAPPPQSLRRRGLIPDLDPRDLLAQRHRLVIFALLPAIAMPLLRHRDGGAFLEHRGLRVGWSPADAAAVAAECSREPPLSPGAAAMAWEPIIERLQAGGAAVAVCTAFRHVNEPQDHRGSATAVCLREQIRRCNLEVAQLSRRTGCFVLDLDRPLAQEGGASLQADCFGGNGRAADIALDEFAALILDALPDAATMEDA
jgi:hypothetical protein